MSLLLITNPPTELTVSSQWGDFVNRSGKNMLGYGLSIPVFSLTNWDASTTKPEIAAGSIIEVGGSFYQADSDTALTDESGISDGTVHIKLVPAGGGASVVPTLTNDAIPTWSAVKAGWYDNDDMFLPYEMTKASAAYSSKGEYQGQNKTNNVVTQQMTGTMKWKYYYKGTNPTEAQVFSDLSSWVPNIDDEMATLGQAIGEQVGGFGVIMSIYRISSTEIRLYLLAYGVGRSISIDSGNTALVAGTIEMMSNFDSIT
ncbi:MAG: hypothetical protein GY804_13940 [Alphaproteobacteria bacterium]|nr:hypothetical protein [Alphaproteobacteria bacterium]